MKKILAMLAISMMAIMFLLPSVANAATADSTGFTAKIVAVNNQRISGTVNAAGYDVGVYVGRGVTGVVITNAIITGANDHGIYIQDTSDVVVKDSVITGNGVSPYGGPGYLTENKAITLAGTHDVLIKNNTVSYNLADGGISIIDDGPVHPAQPNPGTRYPSYNNVVRDNLVINNVAGCAIVVAAKNSGEGVWDNLIMNNTVIGNHPGSLPPFIGAIVVAGTYAANNQIINNTVEGGWLPGIVVHSFKPGDVVTGTMIQHNTLIANSPDEVGDGKTAGISLFASPVSTISNTHIGQNTVINDYYGVWHVGDTNTKIIQLKGNAVVPVAPP